MRIACPTCSAAYEVPDSVLSSGIRKLRCARCAHEWTPQAPDPVVPAPVVAVPPPAAKPAPPPAVEQPAATSPPAETVAAGPPPKPRRVAPPPPPPPPAPEPLVAEAPLVPPAPPRNRAAQLGLAAAWALSFAVLAGAATAGWVYRERVASAWPPSQRLYAALGLTPTAH